MASISKSAIALCVLFCGCDNVGDSIKKNWSGNGQSHMAATAAGAPIAGSPSLQTVPNASSYTFTSALRGAQQGSCTISRFDLVLVFSNDLTNVTARVFSGTWPCGPIASDGDLYYVECDAPAGSVTQGSVIIALDRLPPASHITAEATLTVMSGVTGTCKQEYALSGDRQ